MWQQWVNGVLGLWVIIVPFLGFSAQAAMWTLAITGLAVAVLGFWGAAQFRSEEHAHMGRQSHA